MSRRPPIFITILVSIAFILALFQISVLISVSNSNLHNEESINNELVLDNDNDVDVPNADTHNKGEIYSSEMESKSESRPSCFNTDTRSINNAGINNAGTNNAGTNNGMNTQTHTRTCRYDEIGKYLEASAKFTIIHRPSDAIPAGRKIPKNQGNNATYIAARRSEGPKDGSLTHCTGGIQSHVAPPHI